MAVASVVLLLSALVIVASARALFPAVLSLSDYNTSKMARLFVDPTASPGPTPMTGYATAAGDFNGDRIMDVAFGAPWATTYKGSSSRTNAGRVTIVFGESLFNPSSYSSCAIDGRTENMYFGSVLAAGDIDCDGYDDVVIGNYNTGKVFVVFGSRTMTSTVYTDELSSESIIEITGSSSDYYGYAVAAGAFIRSYCNDIVIGAPTALGSTGKVYVVSGRSSWSASNSITTLSGVTTITGEDVSFCGLSVGLAGDADGDQYDDFIIGAPLAPNGLANGRAYIIFGSYSLPSSISLASLTSSVGVAINGANGGELGSSVGGGFDVNRDGYADVIIGAAKARPNGVKSAGTATLILGRRYWPSSIDTDACLPSSCITFNCDSENGLCGSAVSGAGDINGDGCGDITIGS
jgi:hypothetical protein